MIIDDLKAYRAKKLELESLEDKKERLKAQRERITAKLGLKGGTNGNVSTDKLLNDLIKIEALEEQINGLIIDLTDEFVKLNRAIKMLEPVEQMIIRLYYLQGLKWKAVAKKTNYSVNNCWRLQSKALERLKE